MITTHAHDHEHEHGHGHGHEAAHAQGKEVRVSAAAARAMGLKTVRAEKRRMQSTVSLWGRVELAPDARRGVASSVGGRVQLKVRPLQEVKIGDVLFTVDAPEVRAKTKEIELLERRLKVYRDLNRASAELETQLALRKAEREALLAGAEETNGVVAVRATEAGRVDTLSVLDGAWVSPGAAVVEFVRPERMRIKALVAASEAARLKDGLEVTLGHTNGGWTEITGLPDDEDLEIVKEGAYELKIALSAQAGAQAAGHFHADGSFHESED